MPRGEIESAIRILGAVMSQEMSASELRFHQAASPR
jgi:hypothetical protein